MPVLTEKKTILKVTGLNKTYISGSEQFHAIKNIDMDLYKGDFTVIMGSSGSGKSTLLYMLSGLDSVTRGEIYFNGRRIDRFTEQEMADFRARKIGYVYQSINLVPDLTLLENVAFPGYIAGISKSEVNKKAATLLKRVGLSEHQNRLPSQVSGGQQQRAAISRALINSPEIIFADEPTGALSHEQGMGILDIFTQMNEQGQSIVMVTHDIKAACRANRLIVVRDGMIGGILELGSYRSSDMKLRESTIFNFVSEKE
ncbi:MULTISPECIES: ABC transporter ATP-binding protein [Paenibacillus]|uniref:ABC transporter ATP-binding protein n=1 Tax=Paenibacillus alvei TaxID=44250 RepID=A0ABT4E8U0_PAEAL|nr:MULTISPECIES: ABC transporter ATP-binding protein [Paenibacillus]EPY13700.1 ABC transporter-like protein [Paenibacillus alvei A6-6i-x]MCY9530154.1 ABC transporter ATP-binding protein [Paenibacillus alvei]SDF63960.1 putative ABC transport system ATP-binding protein [Paenibacillus sp. cl6col]